jgi:hypothetical protein
MASPGYANAFPRKHFFMEMFTRDISFEDCILDLIDNSIDSLVREQDIDPARDILSFEKRSKSPATTSKRVTVQLDQKEIVVEDNCGGIPHGFVEDELFTFGHSPEFRSKQQLGIYGIGLKRAIFKIAEHFEMQSTALDGSLRAELDIQKWAEKDEDIKDWRIPVEFGKPAKSERQTGTVIRFAPLRSEVKMRLRDGALLGRLTQSIAQTYSLFLEQYVRVELNDVPVSPESIPLGTANDIKPGQADFSKGEVKVRIMCGLAARNPFWTSERAGWYVLCNGRVVVAADKTDLTGWNVGLPGFHSKYKGFVGVVIFRSKDPLSLPWTTTKRGLNRESPIYQDVKREMILLARPIITFLNNMYRSDSMAEEPEEREIAGKVIQADLVKLASQRPAIFKVETASARPKTTSRIQYDASISDLDRIRRVLMKPKWSANKIGRYTFEHFLKQECPE